MSVADINARVAAAVASIDAGDFAAAYPKLLAAKALLAATPDAQKNTGSLHWDRAAIDSLIVTVERQVSLSTAAGRNGRGVVRTNVRYKRSGSSDDC